jgi:hypothetical protein
MIARVARNWACGSSSSPGMDPASSAAVAPQRRCQRRYSGAVRKTGTSCATSPTSASSWRVDALSRRPFRSHPLNNSRTGRRSHRRPGRTVRDRANGPRRAPPFDLRRPRVGGAALMPTGLGAIAVLDAEQGHPDANIRSFADPHWSATTTVAPGRLRRLLPGTTTGRLVAVALMVMCIALVGAVTASVAVARGQRRATGDREYEVVAPSALADRAGEAQGRFGSESWGFPGGRLRIHSKKTGLTRHFELARGLEPLTCCLQDSCATDCATPAMPGKPTQSRS